MLRLGRCRNALQVLRVGVEERFVCGAVWQQQKSGQGSNSHCELDWWTKV